MMDLYLVRIVAPRSHITRLLIAVYFFARFLLRSLFASPELLAAPFGLFALLALVFF
jgi:hypothetical protein